MRIAQVVFNILVVNPFAFRADWAWGVPLIVLTVVIHVVGIELVSQRAAHVSPGPGAIGQRGVPVQAHLVWGSFVEESADAIPRALS
jgi:hypothetical protein